MPGKNFEVKRLYVVNPGSEDERVYEGLRTVNTILWNYTKKPHSL